MRKIVSQEVREKNAKKNQLIIGIVLISLLVFSTLGFAFSFRLHDGTTYETEEIEYQGISFSRDSSGFWGFSFQGANFLTRYNPNEVGDVSFSVTQSLNSYSNKPLYFVGEGEGVAELVRNLNSFALRINGACLDENCTDYPIKDCFEDNIIIFQESDQDLLYQEENCVYISTSLVNQPRYADAYLFRLLGIS